MKNGSRVSYYIKQTTWDTFEEIEIRVAGEESISCGGITVTPQGVPYLLSRDPPAVVYYGEDDTWVAVELQGLTSDEARGALRGRNTVIHLTPDRRDGIFLGLSLGFELGSQPLFLAKIADGKLNVLQNGWSDDNAYKAVGHAPQFLVYGDTFKTIIGRNFPGLIE